MIRSSLFRIKYIKTSFLIRHFSNEAKKEENLKKFKFNEENFKKYEDICSKEKEKIQQLEKKISKSEFFSSQITRIIMISFVCLINIYIFKELYSILWNFCYPYDKDNTYKEKLNEK